MENNTARSPGTGTGSADAGAAYGYYGSKQEIASDTFYNVSAPVPMYAWQQQQQQQHRQHRQQLSPSGPLDAEVDADLLWVPAIAQGQASFSASPLPSAMQHASPLMQAQAQSPPSSPPPLVSAISSSHSTLPAPKSGAVTPQSTVSSTFSSSATLVGSSNLTSTSPSRVVRKKPRSIDRNRRPCGACSSSKRKCKLVSLSPELCERCRKHGLSACPPHVAWSRRRVTVSEDGAPHLQSDSCPSREDSQSSTSSAASLSPGASDYDSRSRSASPLFATGSAPYGNLEGFQQQQQQQQMAHDAYYAPSPCMSPEIVNDTSLPLDFSLPGPATDLMQAPPRCHVCSTPYAYDQLMLGYMLAASDALMPNMSAMPMVPSHSLPSPAPSGSPSDAGHEAGTSGLPPPYVHVSEPGAQAYQNQNF